MSNYWATREVMTFDVDKFIADVYKKYEQMAQENAALAAWAKTEEELRKLWDAVLNVRRPGGDASLYPNQHGPQPALMEVWHKAGDFWRAKYRLGDTLLCDQNGAALSPQELGWITKAKHVINPNNNEVSEGANTQSTGLKHLDDVSTATDTTPAAAGATNTKANITTDQGVASSDAREPIFTDADADEQREAMPNVQTKAKRARRPKKAVDTKPQQLSMFDEELQAEEQEPASDKVLRSVGYLAAASVAIILVWQTGLIIPLGLIGLATSGLLR